MEDIQTAITPTTMAATDITAQIKDLQTELNQDISALSDEIGGSRRHTTDQFINLQSQSQDQHASIHQRLTELTAMIERALKIRAM
ncbi:hypothetical protein ACFQYP_50180 [Nonomuraea antimicrobica]